ncbi:MAG: Uma2 family endonuclease [Deinococcota bacterium]
MRQAPVKTDVGFADYLEFEEHSQHKHEFVNGELFMMAGASERHNRIALNIAAVFLASSRTTGCRVFISDMKVKLEDDTVYYPDVMVVCDDSDDHAYYKTKPCLIIEVLSDSTEAIDRGEKLHAYRRISSLQAYVLVNQHHERLEVFRLSDDGRWFLEDILDDQVLTLPCVNLGLSVDDVYAGL